MTGGGEDALQEVMEAVGVEAFVVVSLFSITMWVHLNHGDGGLASLIARSAKWSSFGLVVEPQPWKCYKSAQKRVRRLNLSPFPYKLADLQAKDPDRAIFDICLQREALFSCGWSLGREEWGRALVMYFKSASASLRHFADRMRFEYLLKT